MIGNYLHQEILWLGHKKPTGKLVASNENQYTKEIDGRSHLEQVQAKPGHLLLPWHHLNMPKPVSANLWQKIGLSPASEMLSQKYIS